MSKIINVTADLISQACRSDSSHCMIADAIRSAMPHASHVVVDLQTIRYTDRKKGERRVYFTPLLAQQQLLRFDQGVEVLPWTFRIPATAAQVTKVKRRDSSVPNTRERPSTPGPRQLEVKEGRNSIPTVRGGKTPPLAVLSNSRGRRRVFGIRAARGFDPSQAG